MSWNMCLQPLPNDTSWSCSLEKGHLGDHKAHRGWDTSIPPEHVWPNETPAKEIVTPEMIAVPEGLLDAFMAELLNGIDSDGSKARRQRESWRREVSAVLAYIANHPKRATKDELEAAWNSLPDSKAPYPYWTKMAEVIELLQSQMFLKPSPAIPAGVKALLIEIPANQDARNHNEAVLAAYALGEMNGRAKA